MSTRKLPGVSQPTSATRGLLEPSLLLDSAAAEQAGSAQKPASQSYKGKIKVIVTGDANKPQQLLRPAVQGACAAGCPPPQVHDPGTPVPQGQQGQAWTQRAVRSLFR